MNRWFRWYEGTVEDGKFRAIARASRVTVRDVLALWAFMLEDAAHLEHRGICHRNSNFMASVLDFEDGVIERILNEMQNLKMITCRSGAITVRKWRKRQFELSDNSSDRVRRHRAKRAAAGLMKQWSASKELRAKVYARDGYSCVYCGSEADLTIDHRMPEMRGGTHDIENLQTTCRRCNASKRDLTHEEFVSRNGISNASNGEGNVTETFQQRPHRTETEEQNTEKKEDTAKAVSTLKTYFFDSGVIRLSKEDFEKWREAYPNLDLKAELFALTQWANDQGNKWFFAVSGALAKRNREMAVRLEGAKHAPDKGRFRGGPIEGIV